MVETRTITIESPAENILSVQVEADLVDRFVHEVTEKGGLWRSKRKKETFQKALESAVAVALTKFLEGHRTVIGIPVQPISKEEIIVAFSEMLERTITGVITLLAADNPEDEEKGYRILEESIDAGKRLEMLARSSLVKVKVLEATP